jgi:hypothetical protein
LQNLIFSFCGLCFVEAQTAGAKKLKAPQARNQEPE